MRRRAAIALVLVIAGAILAITAGVVLSDADSASQGSPPVTRHVPPPSRPAHAATGRCVSQAVLARAAAVTRIAKRRYDHEHYGVAVHDALRRVARDPALVADLARGNLSAALGVANHQLILHTVRIRIVQHSQVLVDANPKSFAVGGALGELYGLHNRPLGRAEVTVQDVIGFIKLVHKYHPGDVVVRGASGEVKSSLPGAAHAQLPSSGCAQVGGHSYVVQSFHRTGFAGERLKIWVLV